MHPALINYALLIALGFIWGSSFILIKRGLVVFDPMQVAALRLLITSLFMLPFIVYGYRQLPKGKFKYIVISGIIGSGFPAFLFPLAQTQIDSSLAGILNSLTPVFTLLIGLLVFNIVVNRANIAGIVCGFAGAAVLILMRGSFQIEGEVFFAFWALMGSLCYGLNTNILKKYLQGVTPILIASGSMLCLGPPSAVYLFSTDFVQLMATDDYAWWSFLYVAIIGILGTGIALILFNRLLQRTNPLFASSGTYLIPAVAVFWGILDGEVFTLFHLTGIALIMSGIYLTRVR